MAKSQSDSNIATAQATQRLNMVNTYGPDGSVTYQTDPNAPGGYSQTTSLSPGQQGIYDQGNAAQNAALGVANQQIGRVGSALSQNLSTAGLPALVGSVGGGYPSSYGQSAAPSSGGGYDYYSQQAPTSGSPGAGAKASGAQPPQAIAMGAGRPAPGGQGGAPGIASSFASGQPLQYSAPQGQALQYSSDQGGPVQSSFDHGGPVQYSFDQGQQVQGQVGPVDLAGANRQAQNAAYSQATSRLDPQFSQAENAERTRLVNQGLSENSDAYRNAMDTFNRGKTDAYSTAQNQAVAQGNNAEQMLFGEDLSKGQFANSAAGQQYAQNQGQAAFHNNAAGQDFGQNATALQLNNAAAAQQSAQNLSQAQLHNAAAGQQFGQDTTAQQMHNQTAAQDYAQNQGQATFGNNAQQQGFTEDFQNRGLAMQGQNQQFTQGLQNAQLSNEARNQGLQEQAYIQNQPLNQFSALMGMGQVAMPNGVQYTPAQVANTDVIGANALATQAQQANAARSAQSQSGLMGGLFSLGSAALMASDVRLKTDRRLLRTRRDGVRVWSFRYRDGGPVQIGVMAQELRKVRPDLVVRRPDGFLAVNYMPLGAL